MGAFIGHYELCAAGGAERAGDMWLGEAYQRGGWGWVRSRLVRARSAVRAAGGTLDFFVLKYPFGQDTDLDGRPEPGVLDILEARDRGVAPDVVGAEPLDGMRGLVSLSRWASVQRLRKYMYLGKAPTHERLQELQENPRDMEFVAAWLSMLAGMSGGWKLIADSGSYPEHADETRAFIALMDLYGCPASVWDSEAYCIGGGAVPAGTWPNQSGVRCWGENTAWEISGMPDSRNESPTDIGLLHEGSEASADVLAAAATPGAMVAMNVIEMVAGDLRMVMEAAAGAVAGGEA